MKDAVIGILALIIGFLLWNGRQADSYDGEVITADRVSPDVTQVIIEEVQKNNPDTVPLETLFINHQGDGVYKARFMFFNTRHYFGIQYDVQAKVNQDGSVSLLDTRDVASTDYSKAYKPDLYQSWDSVQASLDAQLKDALSKPVSMPPNDAYKPTMR
jgi:hypothetical protein